MKNIYKIGITGGIGSGKSAVCDIFAKLDVPVLHSDDIAKELCNSDSTVRKKLISILGQEAYLPDGSINREFIAKKIFSNKGLRRKVETVIHPRVEQEREKKICELKRHGHEMLIVEAAIIYEVGLDEKLDTVIVVDADEAERVNRVCKRDMVPEDEVRRRIASQLDVKKKLKKADFIIYNNGTIEELEQRVRFLYNLFKRLANEGISV